MIKYDSVLTLLNDGNTQDCLSFLRYCYENNQSPDYPVLLRWYEHLENREWISKLSFQSDRYDGANIKDFLIKVADLMDEIDGIANAGDLYLPALKELRNWIKENAE